MIENSLEQKELVENMQKDSAFIPQYDEMAEAEAKEADEAASEEKEDDKFDFTSVKETKLKKAKQALTTAAPLEFSTSLDEKKERLRKANQKRRQGFEAIYENVDPLLNIGRRFVAGGSEALFIDTPEFAALGLEYGAKGISASGKMILNSIKRGYNAGVRAIEDSIDNEVSLDQYKGNLHDPFNYSWADEWTKPAINAIREWVKTEGEALNKEVVRYVGHVPDYQRTWFTELAHKTAEMGMPIVPFLSGVSMVLRYPRLFRNTKDIADGMLERHARAGGKLVGEAFGRGVGIFNSALGAGFAWQTGETFFKGTRFEGMAPFLALPGAMYGATGLTRLPFTVAFGVGLAAMGKIAGYKITGEKVNPVMLRAMAMSANIPLKDIFSKNPDALQEQLALSTDRRHLDYIDDLVKGYKSLPPKYQNVIKEAYEKTHYFMEKYQGKKGEKLAFFMSQVTGLGVQQAIVKSSIEAESLGLFKMVVGKQLSDHELYAETINNQIKVLQDAFEDLLKQDNLAKPENSEFTEIIDVLRKQLNHNAASSEDLIFRIRDMQHEASILTNTAKIRAVHEVADEHFHYNRIDGDNVDPSIINARKEALNKRQVGVFESAWKAAKPENDRLFDIVKKDDRLIDGTPLILMAKEEKALAELSSLKTKATPAGRLIKTQADIIFNARRNTLEKMDSTDLLDAWNILRRSAIEDDVVYQTAKGSDIDFKAIGEELQSIKNPNLRDDTLRDYLSDITTNDMKAFDEINDIIPPRYLLSDLLAYRSELYTRYRRLAGSPEGHVVSDLIDSVDETLDGHFANVADGTKVKKAYDTAKKFYKERILPFKSHLGTKIHDTVYKLDNFGDDYGPESLFAMFTRFKDDETMGKVFNGIFHTKADKKEAAELFQTTIGRILNGDVRGYKSGFINQMTLDQIAAMQKHGMITEPQFKGLAKIIKHRDGVRASVDDLEQQVLRKTFDDSVIPSLQNTIRKEYGEGSDLAQTILRFQKSDDMLDAIINEHSIPSPHLDIEGSARPALTRAEDTLTNVSEELGERFARTIDEVPSKLKTETVLTHVLRTIDNTNISDKKKIELLENLERMLIYKVYKHSFNLTPNRNLTKTTQYKNGVDDKWVDANHSGLLSDIDVVGMGEALTNIGPALKKVGVAIDTHKRNIGMSAKREKETTHNLLTEIVDIATISLAKVSNVPVRELAKSLAMSSLLSRGYALARGVVSLKFVAGDLFLRVQHKKKMEYITNVLTNPESVRTMHDVLVKGKKVNKQQVNYWRYVIGLLVGKEVMEEIKDSDIENGIHAFFSDDLEEFLNIKKKKISARVTPKPVSKFDGMVLREEDLSFLPNKATMQKLMRQGKKRRPSKYHVDIGKAGMPKRKEN